MKVPPHYDTAQREAVLNQWYRSILKHRLPKSMAKWQPEMKVEASFVGIKRMKTKWGSCNPQSARVWINLELVKNLLNALNSLWSTNLFIFTNVNTMSFLSA